MNVNEKCDGALKIIMDYLKEYAVNDEAFKEKLEKCPLDPKGLYSEIKKLAEKLAVNGVAMVDDATVFGWAVHIVDEAKEMPKTEKIDFKEKIEKLKELKQEVKEEQVKVSKPKTVEDLYKGMSLFD